VYKATNKEEFLKELKRYENDTKQPNATLFIEIGEILGKVVYYKWSKSEKMASVEIVLDGEFDAGMTTTICGGTKLEEMLEDFDILSKEDQ
jgi:hypothetical protein